jgi:hypothetical protein
MKSEKRIELVVTDGKRSIRSFWLEQRKAGIYGGFITPRISLHRSYHVDGNVHFRVEGSSHIGGGENFFNPSGYSKEVIKASPLSSFPGHFHFFNGGLRLDKDVLDEGIPYKFRKVENLLLIDTRNIHGHQKHLTLIASMIQAHTYSLLQFRFEEFEKICQSSGGTGEYHLFTKFQPWILVFLMFSAR